MNEYAKAFKVLTARIKKITDDKKAALCLFINSGLRAILKYKALNDCHYFRCNDRAWSDGNCMHHSVFNPNYVGKCLSISNAKGFTKQEFIRFWIENAIGNELCAYNHQCYMLKFLLDKNETIESLCVEYDMKL